jgi:glycosyltransferase involved in cell wall biosynthesis
MYKNKKISVVIPAYNEEMLIEPTLRSIPDYIDKIYAVDDGSPDNTFELIEEIAEEDRRIIPIKREVNRGVGAAIVTGYKRSLEDGIDIAVVMAGDNQMDPAYILSLVDPIIENRADYTKGNRLMKAARALNGGNLPVFTRGFLIDVRRRALRRGVWYSALDVVEREILSLASQILDTVRSGTLSIQLVRIIAKINDTCKSNFAKHLERFGMGRVRVIQAQAASFGYREAEGLSRDSNFMRYLIFIDFNQPIGWRIYS